jgi:peptide/nickel transport system permease protein
MYSCGICKKEIRDQKNSLYCRHCKAVFHRKCFFDHFYYYRTCPSCTVKISFEDVHTGIPLTVMDESGTLPGSTTPSSSSSSSSSPYRSIVPDESTDPSHGRSLALRRTLLIEQPIAFRPKKGLRAKLKKIFTTDPERAGIVGRFLGNTKGKVGTAMLIITIVIAILAPILILYDPVTYLAEDIEYVNHPPTWKYPFGTDVFGRDIYSQVIWGFRSAMIIALPSALIIGSIGTVVGLSSGYYGGIVDSILQRFNMTFLVWPSVPLVALIVYSWGATHALLAVILGVSFTLWPTTARAIRAEVMSIKSRSFIDAARISGATARRIIFRHILPNVIHIAFLYMTLAVASALVLEATFNFLGLTSPAVITWGSMLSFTYFANTARFGVGGGMAWWAIIPPGLSIAFVVISFYFISSGLRESITKTSKRV